MKIAQPPSETPAAVQSICAECGAAYEQHDDAKHYGRCDECRQQVNRERERYRQRGKTAARGYGSRWQRQSRRLRRLQDFCEDCGATDELTVDHSVTAWTYANAGRTIPDRYLSVVCTRCNIDRGAARGDDATDEHRPDRAAELEEIETHYTITPANVTADDYEF